MWMWADPGAAGAQGTTARQLVQESPQVEVDAPLAKVKA